MAVTANPIHSVSLPLYQHEGMGYLFGPYHSGPMKTSFGVISPSTAETQFLWRQAACRKDFTTIPHCCQYGLIAEKMPCLTLLFQEGASLFLSSGS